MGLIESKTFKNGNSVAVRLPRRFGIDADVAVTIEPTARGGVTIEPIVDSAEEKRKLAEMIKALRALGPVTPVGQRELIEFPDRPGL